MAPAADFNEEGMRLIGTRLGSRDAIDRVEVFPPETPDRIVATFAEALYPPPVTDAWLELRLRLNDDVNAVYAESWDGERWDSRWGRQDNDHNAREPGG